MDKKTLETCRALSLLGSKWSLTLSTDTPTYNQQSWGCSLHACLNTKNTVPTCHILSFEPPSGFRDEFGFILGVTLKGRHEGTLRHQAQHPTSPQRSPPAPGHPAPGPQRRLLGLGGRAGSGTVGFSPLPCSR